MEYPVTNHHYTWEEYQELEAQWSVRICDQMSDSLLLPEINSEVDLSAIYQGVEFGPEITCAEEQAAKYAAENANN